MRLHALEQQGGQAADLDQSLLRCGSGDAHGGGDHQAQVLNGETGAQYAGLVSPSGQLGERLHVVPSLRREHG